MSPAMPAREEPRHVAAEIRYHMPMILDIDITDILDWRWIGLAIHPGQGRADWGV
jgi:hypothetical protein